ncbi:MAG: hypothetical protein NVSMB27_28870 [Ktedonobacteraceae bacterium]
MNCAPTWGVGKDGVVSWVMLIGPPMGMILGPIMQIDKLSAPEDEILRFAQDDRVRSG